MSIPGAIYCRISSDAEGLALGVERQREDCIELARLKGIDVPEDRILIENDRGASAHSTKSRPEYDRLCEMVASGEVQAVVFYSNSRLTRRPMEFETWIRLHEQTGVRLISKVSGDDDLGTADGRMVARIKASVDAAEAERISERVRRSFEQRRSRGLMASGGPRPFGFDRSTTPPSHVPSEAEAIRRGCELIISGASIGAVARDWTEAGVRPVQAKTWTRVSIRRILMAPRIAGLVEHDGEVVGAGVWEPIVDRATWEAVVDVLSGNTRQSTAARVHLLAGYVFCGVCGNRLYSANGAGRQNNSYRCIKERQGCGSVKRNKPWLDAVIDGYMRQKIEEEGAVEVEEAPSAIAEQVQAAEERIAEVRRRHADGLLDSEDFFPLLSGMRTKLNDLRKQQAEETRVTTQKAALLDPMKVWESGSLTARRALIASYIKGVYVKPVGRIGRAEPPADSIEIVPT